jgi:hypothetical protein
MYWRASGRSSHGWNVSLVQRFGSCLHDYFSWSHGSNWACCALKPQVICCKDCKCWDLLLGRRLRWDLFFVFDFWPLASDAPVDLSSPQPPKTASSADYPGSTSTSSGNPACCSSQKSSIMPSRLDAESSTARSGHESGCPSGFACDACSRSRHVWYPG